MKLVLGENLADCGHFELEDQTEEGLFFSCRDDLADNGQVDGGQQEVLAVADIKRLADVDALLALQEDNQAGLVCSRGAGGGDRAAVEAKA